MPSQLTIGQTAHKVINLINEAAKYEYILTKVVKKGTLLPNWPVSHPDEWNNVGGNFDMQSYLHEYLQQYGLDWVINGNNQLEIISWP